MTLPRALRTRGGSHRLPMSSSGSHPFVLLVDDSEDDVFFFTRALRAAGFGGRMQHLADGAAAVAYFKRLAEGASAAERPDVVFLDLKMPQLSGFEVLAWLRDHPLPQPLDVAVLSGSEDGADVARASRLGASSYFVKPIPAGQLKERLAALSARTAILEPAKVS